MGASISATVTTWRDLFGPETDREPSEDVAAHTWRMRQAIFRGGWFDPARSDGQPVAGA